MTIGWSMPAYYEIASRSRPSQLKASGLLRSRSRKPSVIFIKPQYLIGQVLNFCKWSLYTELVI